MCRVLENQLFEIQESSLVRDFLSDLNTGSPGIGSETLLAVRTLLLRLAGTQSFQGISNLVCHHVFDFKCLL